MVPRLQLKWCLLYLYYIIIVIVLLVLHYIIVLILYFYKVQHLQQYLIQFEDENVILKLIHGDGLQLINNKLLLIIIVIIVIIIDQYDYNLLLTLLLKYYSIINYHLIN